MKLLIDIGHPAHVHLFKNLATELQKEGNDVFFTCREKEFETALLKHYGFRYRSFGEKYYSSLGKIWGLIEFSLKEIIEGIKFKPDLILSHGSMYAAYASRVLGVPHISLEDTGNMEQIILYKPFTDVILTPDVIGINLGEKQVSYKGYHEIAYLHPNRLRLEELPGELDGPYVVIRFVSWAASHDVGQKGLTRSQKFELVERLSKTHKVVISAERNLEQYLQPFAANFPPHLMHTVLKNADLFIGEGATMASESAVLGTPAIYINSIPISYCIDLEKFGLVFNFSTAEGLFEKVDLLLKQSQNKTYFTSLRDNMIANKIDLTSFLLWFIERYPESFAIMKSNPDFQNNFRTP